MYLVSCKYQAIFDQAFKPAVRQNWVQLHRRVLRAGFSVHLDGFTGSKGGREKKCAGHDYNMLIALSKLFAQAPTAVLPKTADLRAYLSIRDEGCNLPINCNAVFHSHTHHHPYEGITAVEIRRERDTLIQTSTSQLQRSASTITGREVSNASYLGAKGVQVSSCQGHASGSNDLCLEERVGLRCGYFRRALSHALAHDANTRPAPERYEKAACGDVLHGRARGDLVAIGVGDVDPGKAYFWEGRGRGRRNRRRSIIWYTIHNSRDRAIKKRVGNNAATHSENLCMYGVRAEIDQLLSCTLPAV